MTNSKTYDLIRKQIGQIFWSKELLIFLLKMEKVHHVQGSDSFQSQLRIGDDRIVKPIRITLTHVRLTVENQIHHDLQSTSVAIS